MESHDVFVRFMQRTERRVSPFRINMVHSQSFRTGLWKLSSLGDSANSSDGVSQRYYSVDYTRACQENNLTKPQRRFWNIKHDCIGHRLMYVEVINTKFTFISVIKGDPTYKFRLDHQQTCKWSRLTVNQLLSLSLCRIRVCTNQSWIFRLGR